MDDATILSAEDSGRNATRGRPRGANGAGECECGGESRVIEVRHTDKVTRRRLECRTCKTRWTTKERREDTPYVVVDVI